MANYAATGNPPNGTRNISESLRREFKLIESAIASKGEANGFSGTSITTLTIGTGNKTLTIQANKSIVIGMTVFIADTAAPSNNMTGTVTDYTPSTGLLRVNVTSISGSGTKSSWSVGLSSPTGVSLTNNTFIGYQNFAQATVASSATTSDIWNALGNQILFTGTATVTAFPAAPQPGATRELVCQAACQFTASANLLIEGINTGDTYTAHVNDTVVVRAITISQFLLTIERYDGKVVSPIVNTKAILSVAPGFGSTNTAVRRYTNIVSNTGQGVDWNLAQSTTLGDSFTILRSGVYSVYAVDNIVSNSVLGITVNATVLNGTSQVLDPVIGAAVGFAASTGTFNLAVTRTLFLASSSVIRVMGNGLGVSQPSTTFQIERIS